MSTNHDEAYLLQILNQLQNPIWTSDSDSNFNFLNKSWHQFTGKNIDQETSNNWTDDIHPEDKDIFLKTYQESFHNKQSFQSEFRLKHNDGTYHWISNHCTPFFSPDNQFTGYIGTGIDINKDKEYSLLFSHMTSGFSYHKIITDDHQKPVDFLFLDINNAFEEIIGLNKEAVIGKTVTQILPKILEDPFDWIGKYGGVAQSGQGIKFESFSTALGKWFHVSAYSPKTDYFVTLFEDITPRKLTEESLQKKLKELEIINQLMTGRELKMIELKKEIQTLKQKDK